MERAWQHFKTNINFVQHQIRCGKKVTATLYPGVLNDGKATTDTDFELRFAYFVLQYFITFSYYYEKGMKTIVYWSCMMPFFWDLIWQSRDIKIGRHLRRVSQCFVSGEAH